MKWNPITVGSEPELDPVPGGYEVSYDLNPDPPADWEELFEDSATGVSSSATPRPRLAGGSVVGRVSAEQAGAFGKAVLDHVAATNKRYEEEVIPRQVMERQRREAAKAAQEAEEVEMRRRLRGD
ncbi:MAG: hypothetical protein JKY65_27865 [Planctomycetes bacterium]|nr:hypothetical protein [Planctomycetota bacterium]